MIRKIKQSEFPELVEVGQRFYKESGRPGSLVLDAFAQTWTFLYEKGIGCIYGLYDGDKIRGMIGGFIFPDPNDMVMTATEAFWYVDQQYRGKSGLKLLKSFETWAVLHGAKRIILALLTNMKPEQLDKLYRRLGYRPVEVNYYKEV